MSKLYYIESVKHGPVGNSVLWWRHNSAGYTTNIADAGLYDEHDALLICEHDGNIMHGMEVVARSTHLAVDPCDLHSEYNNEEELYDET